MRTLQREKTVFVSFSHSGFVSHYIPCFLRNTKKGCDNKNSSERKYYLSLLSVTFILFLFSCTNMTMGQITQPVPFSISSVPRENRKTQYQAGPQWVSSQSAARNIKPERKEISPVRQVIYAEFPTVEAFFSDANSPSPKIMKQAETTEKTSQETDPLPPALTVPDTDIPQMEQDNVLNLNVDANNTTSAESKDTWNIGNDTTPDTVPTGSQNPVQNEMSNYNQNKPQGGERLEDAWNIAISVSRKLQSDEYKTGAARSKINVARSLKNPKVNNVSSYVGMSESPKITSEVNLTNMGFPVTLPVETEISDRNFVASVTAVEIPLYQGGRVMGMIRSANALADALEKGKKISEQELKYEVAETYLLVLRVRKLLEVAQIAEQCIRSHETDAQNFFDQGIVTKNVVLAAQVAAAQAQQNVLQAQNGVFLAEAAYNRLLWRPLNQPVLIMDISIPGLSGDLETLTAIAIRQRPEIAALNSQSQAIQAQIDVHRADVLPQVAAVAAHTYLQDNHLNPNSNFTGSIGVAWMPFDGGTSRARQESDRMEAMAVSKIKDETQNSIELQVYKCWLDEKETRDRIAVAEKAVAQAEENLRMVTRGFQEGLVNHTEVLDAQTLQTQAMTNYAHAQYDAILATFKLRYAYGGL